MSRIVREAEAYLAEGGAAVSPPSPMATAPIPPTTCAIVEAASVACRRLGAALLVVATHSGQTALAVSKARNTTPTLALASDTEVARAMALYWGVTPLVAPDIADVERSLTLAVAWARDRGMVSPGDHLVWIRGTLPDDPTHNGMRVQAVT